MLLPLDIEVICTAPTEPLCLSHEVPLDSGSAVPDDAFDVVKIEQSTDIKCAVLPLQLLPAVVISRPKFVG